MIRFIQSTFEAFFKTKKYYQTFTFYVPAPPKRSTGYREKELDKYLSGLLRDYQLESMQATAHAGSSSGMWVVAVVSTHDKKLKELNLNFPESSQVSAPGIEIIHEDDFPHE